MHEDRGLPYSDSWKASHPELSIKLNPNPMVAIIEKRLEENEKLRGFTREDEQNDEEEEYGNPFRRPSYNSTDYITSFTDETVGRRLL